MLNHVFIGKSVFFPEQGILAIGDLHVGFEQSLIESGILVPEQQVKEIIEDLQRIISEIKTKIAFSGMRKNSLILDMVVICPK